MKLLDLKPTHKAITAYYAELQHLAQVEAEREGAVSPAFANLLRHCAKQFNWTLYEQYPLKAGNKHIYPDGALVDAAFPLPYGYWEAKKTQVALEEEIRQKFDKGYPHDNILFQTPERAILYQDGRQRLDCDISRPEALVEILKAFFAYQPPEYEEWHQAVEAFKAEVPKIGHGVLKLIEHERQTNKGFQQAFEQFTTVCREVINPNIAIQAVEEMLIQHLFTERIFRTVFQNRDFVDLNIIAREIENVVRALVFPHGGRDQFFKPLDRFYNAIESAAAVISDFSQKQAFLNTVYEKFFRGFSVNVADTHGIVYTPQAIVSFMVNSIEELLHTEFGRSFSDEGVHILDPFVGTGNFIIHVMQKLRKTALLRKYKDELHCNEVMLLPYYIAALNIEHEYMTLTGEYQPFEGLCFVDTFELAEEKQLGLFTAENTARVEHQKKAPIFVILGNPPYNAGQVNENDNNKNRKYPVMDRRVRETYAKDSHATLLRKLDDPYVKAIRWASDRIGEEGIIAFVTNSSFIDEISFDGMRKHLGQDFNRIYIFDLKGNVRKDSMREGFPIGEQHTVFGLAAMVGIAVTFFVKSRKCSDHKIYYSAVNWKATRKEKFALVEKAETMGKLQWKELIPDKKDTWLTEGLSEEFETFLPLGTKEAKKSKSTDVEAIFKTFSLGVSTNRDRVVYGFDWQELRKRVEQFGEDYNIEVIRYQQKGKPKDIDQFVNYEKIQWSRNLKRHMKNGDVFQYDEKNLRVSLYRPFTKQHVYFADIIVDEPGTNQYIFPTVDAEGENRVICVPSLGGRTNFWCFMTNIIPNLTLMSIDADQCFPFYTYDEDGRNRRENITDWALKQFRAQYQDLSGSGKPDRSLEKWDIFYYIYALLHHLQYREKYAANLKRELPRIPLVKSPFGGGKGEVFWAFADAGKRLADLHVNYEQQPKYPLQFIETGDTLDWRVEKMKLSKDRTQIVYNHFLTLAGIPSAAFDYKLGNKSALHWVIDQYQVTTDKRSGIKNDPNRADEPEYIVNLIQRVITVSVETVKLVNALPELSNDAPEQN